MNKVVIPGFAGRYLVGIARDDGDRYVEVELPSGKADAPWEAAATLPKEAYVDWVYDFATRVMHFAGEG